MAKLKTYKYDSGYDCVHVRINLTEDKFDSISTRKNHSYNNCEKNILPEKFINSVHTIIGFHGGEF